MYRIAVTNRHLCSIDYLSQIEKVAESGLFQAVLVREKDLTEREYTALARSVKKSVQPMALYVFIIIMPQPLKAIKIPIFNYPLVS